MTRIPDFTTIVLRPGPSANDRQSAPHAPQPPIMTPEGIAIKPVYTSADTRDLDFLDGYRASLPFCVAPTRRCMSRSPGRAPVRRILDRGGSNAFYRRNIAAGQKGLSVAFRSCHPTRL